MCLREPSKIIAIQKSTKYQSIFDKKFGEVEHTVHIEAPWQGTETYHRNGSNSKNPDRSHFFKAAEEV